MAGSVVRTNIHRKKMADVLYSLGGAPIDPITKMSIGKGGKDVQGDIIPPNGDMTDLRSKLRVIPITRVVRVTDLEYILYATVDTTKYPDLVGVDINERGLVDARDVTAVIESFSGTGALQAGVQYEYAMRALIV